MIYWNHWEPNSYIWNFWIKSLNILNICISNSVTSSRSQLFCKETVAKNFTKATKNTCDGAFLYLKFLYYRFSIVYVFLQNSTSFSAQLLCRTPLNDCFWVYGVARFNVTNICWRNYLGQIRFFNTQSSQQNQ